MLLAPISTHSPERYLLNAQADQSKNDRLAITIFKTICVSLILFALAITVATMQLKHSLILIGCGALFIGGIIWKGDQAFQALASILPFISSASSNNNKSYFKQDK